MLANNGKLYGMTVSGGANNKGVIFQLDPVTNTYTKKIDFDGTANTAYGSNPLSSLMQASNGKFYGTTWFGGANNKGVIFEFNPVANTCTKMFDFDGTANGSQPHGSLLQASDGMLYGMAFQGGAKGVGVLFQYNLATFTYTKKLDFDWTITGDAPNGSLLQASDGKLYGMTYGGGANLKGVIFQYDPLTNAYATKFDFDGVTNGANTYGSLLKASDGKLYGMTYQGGANNMGVMFHYDPLSNIYTKEFDFDGLGNGSAPQGSFMQASDGKLYGVTSSGGANNMGVMFQFDPITKTYTKKIDFGGITNSFGSLVQVSGGKLYGMTSQGGTKDMGVIFQYDPATNTYTKKLDFEGTTNGSSPSGALVQAKDGKLYGMTWVGGANNLGVIFQYAPATNTYIKKLDFVGAANGGNAFGSLMQASDGKLYGMTRIGGANNLGVIFQYDPSTDTYTKKIDFDGTSKGQFPIGSLLQASDGKLYGMTTQGGINNNGGVMFQYDPATNTYTKMFDFSAADGSNPSGSLVQASDGKLYGMTRNGGANNLGVIFQFDLTGNGNTYTKKFEFADATNGQIPYGSLLKASDGKFYGTTWQGGANNLGVMFQYDPASNIYTKKLDFNGANGKNPRLGNLIEISVNAPLAPVYVTAPVDNAINQNVTVMVTSKALTGATTYITELSPTADFSNGVIIKTGGRSYTFTGLDFNTKYYARVTTDISRNYGKVTSFTTAPPEYFAYVAAPKDNAINTNVSLKLTSNTVIGATTYTIEISQNNTFSAGVATLAGAKSQTFTGLAFSKVYYARVKTDLSVNYGKVTSFTTHRLNILHT